MREIAELYLIVMNDFGISAKKQWSVTLRLEIRLREEPDVMHHFQIEPFLRVYILKVNITIKCVCVDMRFCSATSGSVL